MASRKQTHKPKTVQVETTTLYAILQVLTRIENEQNKHIENLIYINNLKTEIIELRQNHIDRLENKIKCAEVLKGLSLN